jgi:2-C-methyl-D-erythritol 4-phosphate cytidylyltransferase
LDGVNVLIHDGVRPLITEQTITDNINKVMECGSCITCVPATETLVVRQQDDSLQIPSRKDSLIARAPQSFRLTDIISAHRKAIDEGRNDFIDSCTMMSHYGYTMGIVNGPVENIKITTPTDFFVFRAMVQVHENQQIFGF